MESKRKKKSVVTQPDDVDDNGWQQTQQMVYDQDSGRYALLSQNGAMKRVGSNGGCKPLQSNIVTGKMNFWERNAYAVHKEQPMQIVESAQSLKNLKSHYYVPQNDKFDGYNQFPRPKILQTSQQSLQQDDSKHLLQQNQGIRCQKIRKLNLLKNTQAVKQSLEFSTSTKQMKQIDFLSGTHNHQSSPIDIYDGSQPIPNSRFTPSEANRRQAMQYFESKVSNGSQIIKNSDGKPPKTAFNPSASQASQNFFKSCVLKLKNNQAGQVVNGRRLGKPNRPQLRSDVNPIFSPPIINSCKNAYGGYNDNGSKLGSITRSPQSNQNLSSLASLKESILEQQQRKAFTSLVNTPQHELHIQSAQQLNGQNVQCNSSSTLGSCQRHQFVAQSYDRFQESLVKGFKTVKQKHKIKKFFCEAQNGQEELDDEDVIIQSDQEITKQVAKDEDLAAEEMQTQGRVPFQNSKMLHKHDNFVASSNSISQGMYVKASGPNVRSQSDIEHQMILSRPVKIQSQRNANNVVRSKQSSNRFRGDNSKIQTNGDLYKQQIEEVKALNPEFVNELQKREMFEMQQMRKARIRRYVNAVIQDKKLKIKSVTVPQNIHNEVYSLVD